MPFEDLLPGLIGAAIPGIGAQAAAKQQRRWALEDLQAQNLYNSPKEQLRRLREAGLPAAAFFSGGVSSQSDQPRATDIDPTLGLAKGMDNFFLNRIQSMQLKGLAADNRLKNAEADLKESERAWMLSQFRNPFTGETSQIRQHAILAAKMNKDAFDTRAAQFADQMRGKYGEQLAAQEVTKGTLDIQLKRLFNYDYQLLNSFKRDFAWRLKQKGEGSNAWDILEDVLGMFMMRNNITNKF